jgi:NADH dehydrogenase
VSTKIVILGAGYAGVLTAKKLAKKFKKNSDVEVTIIDKNSYHTMLTELHEVAANRVEEDSIRVSLQRIFSGRKVKVVLDHINKIDYEKQTLVGNTGSYAYDYLVMAAGSQPAFYGIPGAEEHAFKLWSYDDAVKLKHHIETMFMKAMNEPDPAVRRRLLTFYVCGAGFTGVEMAGELAEWVPILCKNYEVDRKEVRIVEVDLLDRVIPVLSPKLSAKAQRRLEKMGVEVHLKTSVCSVGSDFIETGCDGSNNRKDETATVIWTAGTQCADITKAAVNLKQVGRGRLQTDAYLRAEGKDNIFIAGDNAFCVPEGHDTPVPQMVEHCEHSAKNIAHNIEVLITGKGEMEQYQPAFHGVMVSIGGRYGVAHVGTAKKKISMPSFLAMFIKHFINIIYFLQLLGWNKIFSYLRHEFFTVRNCRSFVGGHLSNRTPSFLLVPLRLFLGFTWLIEGIKKIGEGWLESPKLVLFFRGADEFFEGILSGTAGGEDVVAGATGAVSGGSVLLDWNIFSIFRIILVNAGDVALKIQFSLMDWFRDTVIYASGDSQLFFQTVIVISEILIGLALLGGLLTTLSAGYSIILQIMFVMTTGLYMGTWWMAFAAIAVLIGGGRIFGLDYYVMPWLKKQWIKLKCVRKSYLYHD